MPTPTQALPNVKESLDALLTARLALKTLHSQNLITMPKFLDLHYDLWLAHNKAQTLLTLQELRPNE